MLLKNDVPVHRVSLLYKRYVSSKEKPIRERGPYFVDLFKRIHVPFLEAETYLLSHVA